MIKPIDAETAVSHVTISMDNDNSSVWTDEGGITWVVNGRDDILEIELSDEDEGETVVHRFRLVEIK